MIRSVSFFLEIKEKMIIIFFFILPILPILFLYPAYPAAKRSCLSCSVLFAYPVLASYLGF